MASNHCQLPRKLTSQFFIVYNTNTTGTNPEVSWSWNPMGSSRVVGPQLTFMLCSVCTLLRHAWGGVGVGWGRAKTFMSRCVCTCCCVTHGVGSGWGGVRQLRSCCAAYARANHRPYVDQSQIVVAKTARSWEERRPSLFEQTYDPTVDAASSCVLPCSPKGMMTHLVGCLKKHHGWKASSKKGKSNGKEQWKKAMEKVYGTSKAMEKKCSPIAVRFEAAISNGRDVSLAKSSRKNSTQRNCEEKNRSSHHMVTFVYFVTAGCGPWT